jgi:TolA-binding protein
MRKSLLALPLLACSLLVTPRAHAVSKEMIQLQTQVQQLSDMLQHLQQTNDERMGVLQHLVEQSADSVNKMAQQLTALQGQIEQNGKNDTLPGQIQSLNDSVDELKSRMGQVNKQLTDIQSQLQNVQAQPAGGQPGSQTPATPQGAPMSGAPQAGGQGDAQPPATDSQGTAPAAPNVTGSQNASSLSPGPGAASGPATEQLYQSGLRDYNGARYELANSEFADVLKNAPGSPPAGNASYYLGEIAYRQGIYQAAINYYDIVLEQFAGSPKAPAAQLRKAQAELASQKRDAGIRDLRSLVQRYPTSPEGAQARSLLNGMGVRIAANKPSPGH